jgi:ribosomal protein S11
MATRKKTESQHEVTHAIGDGFVVVWDTHAIAVDVRDDLRDAASDQIERLGNNLISVEDKTVVSAAEPVPPRRRRRARPQAA